MWVTALAGCERSMADTAVKPAMIPIKLMMT
jgi:hypothetical protein